MPPDHDELIRFGRRLTFLVIDKPVQAHLHGAVSGDWVHFDAALNEDPGHFLPPANP